MFAYGASIERFVNYHGGKDDIRKIYNHCRWRNN